MARGPKPVEQLGMDERVVEDKELSKALEGRLRAHDDIAEIRSRYKEHDAKVKERIGVLDLADGDAVRCGRFRIAKVAVASRRVEFETDPTSRLTIELWSGGGDSATVKAPAPAPAPGQEPLSAFRRDGGDQAPTPINRLS